MIGDFMPSDKMEFCMTDEDGIFKTYAVRFVSAVGNKATFRVHAREFFMREEERVEFLSCGDAHIIIEATMSGTENYIEFTCLDNASDRIPFARKRRQAMFTRARVLLEDAFAKNPQLHVDGALCDTIERKLYRAMLSGRIATVRPGRLLRASHYERHAPAAPAPQLAVR
jgi:hypothetical protein